MEPIEWPHSKLPALPPEVQKAREEDPQFAEIFGRALARARGVAYNPEIHYPYRGYRGDVPGASRERSAPPSESEPSQEELRRRVAEWETRWFSSPDGGADDRRG